MAGAMVRTEGEQSIEAAGASATSSSLQQVEGFAVTTKGSVRAENQDSYAVIEREHFRIYAVADGMGGAEAGAAASQLTTQTIENAFREDRRLTHADIVAAVQEANRKVLEESAKLETRRGMGTTIAILVCTTEGFYIANAGDSRVYCVRNNQICRLTEDHTVVSQLLRAGTITRDQAKKTPFSNILTSFVGFAPDFEVDCWKSEDGLFSGDRFVLCSDGLHGALSDAEILHLARAGTAQDAAKALVDAALKAGSSDNVTVIVVSVGDGFPTLASRKSQSSKPPALTSVSNGEPTAERRRTASSPNSNAPASRRRFAVPILLGGTIALVLALLAGFSLGRGTAARNEFTVSDAVLPAELVDLISAEQLANDSLQDAGTAPVAELSDDPAELEEALRKTRIQIDLETRRIAAWYRRDQALTQGDPLRLAGEVALSSPEVRKLREQFERLHARYLQEAETLIYSPTDLALERRVNDLAEDRKETVNSLRAAIERVVRQSLATSLAALTDLSRQRDRLEAALQASRAKAGTATETPNADLS